MRIGIVAGELSGDQLGGTLVEALKQKYPNAIIEGIGGPKMAAAGFKSLYPMDALSLIGFLEIISKGLRILSIRRKIINYFKQNKPDIFIGIDAPDFNLTVEKELRSVGIKTIHYVSPKIWVWREYRIKKIRKATDKILAILPFETEYYKNRHKFEAIYVGHPLAKNIPIHIDRTKYRDKLGLKGNSLPILSVLPGSRTTEVSRLLPLFLLALQKLVDAGYKFKAIMPLAKPSLKPLFAKYKEQIDSLGIEVFETNSHDVLKASDLSLLASGTATLEAMLCKLPMVVGYKLSWLSALIGRMLIGNHSYWAFPNILHKSEIIKELIQEDCTVDNLFSELKRLFDDKQRNDYIVEEFEKIHKEMVIDTESKIIQVLNTMIEKS
ncbi:lipid-A-disaccharide synthase [Francisella tularensis subsp. novicida]|uniref:Lipid-A-disaccharide synthase n=2 Tax=Francisella tularensis TaxID=263 RepID=LPXB_FRATN|nr:lipid-A-disaccharide synthase [Francisella tularensis]A0Q7X9.1 RecName: Full=Lipid-A-disaccharide synthase [Francisella tularensis subsp. novicida U112]ABK90344.1 lipid A disaccharide synthetase [Francisella tularensis subsp. novicida U112]AJI60223.1 lipid-A-disaccharide synthase [Francisella tularensis subsp. novicida U112]APC95008.1 lipid-A-disaccharide synthase [Francisella tularensis subsp. novicida]EDX20117.1 lipid-A-disaccharide synthase [Francisella tularensis subsp. novicida FTE]MB